MRRRRWTSASEMPSSVGEAAQPSASMPRGRSVGGPHTVTLAPSAGRPGCPSGPPGSAGRPRRSRFQILQRAQTLAQGEHVQQGLSGCSCLPSPALTRRQSVHGPPAGRPRRRASGSRRRRVVADKVSRCPERLALVDARSGRADADHVGAQPLGRQLEGRARARGGLVEQVDDRPAAQAGTFLMSRPDTSAKDSARSRIRSMPARSRSSMEIRWFMPPASEVPRRGRS